MTIKSVFTNEGNEDNGAAEIKEEETVVKAASDGVCVVQEIALTSEVKQNAESKD